MPPFQLQPRLEVRQTVVLSITRLSTTYTTSLGLSPSTIFPSSSPTQTTVTPPPAVVASQPSGLSSGATAGIVLGSILGTLVLVTLFYKCCINGKSAAWTPTFPSFFSNSTLSLDRNSEHYSHSHSNSTASDRMKRRGRWGDSREARYVNVRKPQRARTRRRERSVIIERDGSMESGRYRERRRRSVVRKDVKDGMVGWSFGGSRDRYEIERRGSGWGGGRRDIERGRMFVVDD